MRLGAINSELVASVRRVNAHYRHLPDNRRPSLAESWNALEDRLRTFAATAELEQAFAAIEKWEADALRAIGVKPGDED